MYISSRLNLVYCKFDSNTFYSAVMRVKLTLPTFHLSRFSCAYYRIASYISAFEQTTTLIVPDMSSLSRNLMSPQAAVSQFSSLPRSSKGFLPTHYPKQSTLSACGSSSSISSTTIPPIVKSGSHNGEIATPQRKIKSTSYKQSIYESVYGEEQQQQVIVGEAQRVSQNPC